jgi:hypothetical protein
MPLEDFEALALDLLGDAIVTDVVQSNRRCEEPIYPKMVTAIGIRVLAGGNYDDLGSARPAFTIQGTNL